MSEVKSLNESVYSGQRYSLKEDEALCTYQDTEHCRPKSMFVRRNSNEINRLKFFSLLSQTDEDKQNEEHTSNGIIFSNIEDLLAKQLLNIQHDRIMENAKNRAIHQQVCLLRFLTFASSVFEDLSKEVQALNNRTLLLNKRIKNISQQSQNLNYREHIRKCFIGIKCV